MADTFGRIGWIDMSVDGADGLRDLYKVLPGRWLIYITTADIEESPAAALYQA